MKLNEKVRHWLYLLTTLTLVGLLATTHLEAQSTSSTLGSFQAVVQTRLGVPAPGANVAICQGLGVTGAVTSNLATLTFPSSNPITSGFLLGSTVVVSAFAGTDAYFNGAYVITNITSNTIQYILTHSNGTSTSTGSVVQQGTSVTSCVPLITLYTDQTGTNTTTNPLTTDGLGNFIVWSLPGVYQAQYYGSTFGTTIRPIVVSPSFSSSVPITGVICDGSSDITTAWNNFMAGLGTTPTHVTVPAGVCMFTSLLSIPDNVWISGQGKTATILRQKAGINSNNALLCINGTSETNIMITDLTVDGNQSAQTTGGRMLNNCASGNPSSITIHDTIWENGFIAAILLFNFNGTTLLNDIYIHDNEFLNNAPGQSVVNEENCNSGDINIFNPLRVRIVNNKSTGSGGNFSCTGGGSSGAGDVVISGNIVKSALGFATALGTVLNNASITGNVFDMPTSRENIIDVGDATFWTVSGNTIQSGNACAVGCGGVGDGPPANHGTITGNTIVGATQGNNTCMVLGGQDVTVSGNTCRGSGQAGIVWLAGSNPVPVQGILITGNTISNCGLANAGHSGIEFFSSSGTFQNIDVIGNRVYDDQVTKTCSYGIGMGILGSQTNFNGFLIADNDVRDVLTAGINNNATPRTNGLGVNGLSVIIRNNPGGDPSIDTAVAIASQTASIGTTTLFTAPTNSVDQYQICVNEVVVVTAGTTSTLPTVNFAWTDRESGGPETASITPTNASGNTKSVIAIGCVNVYPQGGTVVQYSTTGYASNPATTMQYALTMRPKAIN